MLTDLVSECECFTCSLHCHMLCGSTSGLHRTSFLVQIDSLFFCQESVCCLDEVENPLASIFDFQDRPFSLAPHFSDLEQDVFKSKSAYVCIVL